MKKSFVVMICIALMLALCLGSASTQLMKTEDAAGKVTRLYSGPSADSSTVGYVADGTLVDVVSSSGDHKWFRVEAEGELLWIPAAAVTAALPSDLYWFGPLDDDLYMSSAGMTDVYRSRADQIATMLIHVAPDKTASEVIASFEDRLPGGNRLEMTMDGRTAPGYAADQGAVSLSFFAVDLNGGDALCFEITGSADQDDDTMACFMSAVNHIRLTDEVGELSRASRVWCPRCGLWFDSPDSYAAHACSEDLARRKEPTVNYVQCPDCGDWFEEGNIFRNHNCPARSDYVRCPDCGNWFEEGVIFRNHNCPAKDNNYVQCPDCGEWFEEGVIFRNHNCPARENNTPEETEWVQCPDCHEWFETNQLFLDHKCPAMVDPQEGFSQDSEAPEQPEEAIESYTQDDQAYDPYQDEPTESYVQDDQAPDPYDDEPVDYGSQDPDA